MKLSILFLFVLAALTFGTETSPKATAATAGGFEQGFGEGGVVTTDLGAGSDGARAVALQDDGKIVVTGTDAADNLAVLRYNPDGSLDTTFSDDNDGIFTTDQIRRGSDVAIDTKDRILTSGNGDLHLLRLNPDGTPDDSFTADGITGSQFFNPDDSDETYPLETQRVIPWPEGGAVVAGTIDYGPYFFTFARYGGDGTIDKSFGDAGQVQTDFTPPDDGLDQEPLALAAYDNDRFVAAGYRDPVEDEVEASVIAVYDENGELDKSFGDDGKTTSSFIPDEGEEFGDEAIKEVFPLEDGRILVIGDGEVEIGDTNGVKDVPFIARFDPDGTLNDDFGNDGSIVYEMKDSYTVEAAAMAPDGSFVIGGDHAAQTHQAFVARFLPDGTPDPDFGVDGWLTLDFGGGSGQAFDLAIDANGDILGAGGLSDGSGLRVLVFKLKGSAGTPRTFGDINCNMSADSVDALALQRDLAALPVNQTQPCPDIGDIVDIANASQHPWGDMDCDGDVDSVDSLKILRSVAALPVQQEPGCPAIGSAVEVSEVRRVSD